MMPGQGGPGPPCPGHHTDLVARRLEIFLQRAAASAVLWCGLGSPVAAGRWSTRIEPLRIRTATLTTNSSHHSLANMPGQRRSVSPFSADLPKSLHILICHKRYSQDEGRRYPLVAWHISIFGPKLSRTEVIISSELQSRTLKYLLRTKENCPEVACLHYTVLGDELQ